MKAARIKYIFGEPGFAVFHNSISIHDQISNSVFFEKPQQFFEVGVQKHLYLLVNNGPAASPMLPPKQLSYPHSARSLYRKICHCLTCFDTFPLFVLNPPLPDYCLIIFYTSFPSAVKLHCAACVMGISPAVYSSCAVIHRCIHLCSLLSPEIFLHWQILLHCHSKESQVCLFEVHAFLHRSVYPQEEC